MYSVVPIYPHSQAVDHTSVGVLHNSFLFERLLQTSVVANIVASTNRKVLFSACSWKSHKYHMH